MKNIQEYFDDLYRNAADNDEKWEEVNEYETRVYEMGDEEFFKWAEDNNIDLNAKKEGFNYSILQHWCWDMGEAEEYGD